MSQAHAEGKEPSVQERPWLKYYEPGVPYTIEYPDVPLHKLLEDSAVRYARRPALTFYQGSLTYAELNATATRFGGGLMRLGLGKGDRVALVMPNCPQFVIAFYGTLKAGGVVVPTNPLYSERELQYQLKDAGATIVCTLTRFYKNVEAVRHAAGVQHIVVGNIKDYFGTALKVAFGLTREKKEGHRVPVQWDAGTHPFADVAGDRRTKDSVGQAPQVSPDDLAVLQYTGGTTGTAKGAMLSHGNLVANALQSRAWDPSSKDGQETILTVLPLFHVYALTVAMNRGLYSGARLLLLPRYDQAEVLAAIGKYHPTIIPGVPTLYNSILNAPQLSKYDLSSVRACISGSAGLPRSVQERFEAATGGKLVEGYGLSEASPVTHCNPYQSLRKEGSIGLPFPDTDAKIVDTETGSVEQPCGEPWRTAGARSSSDARLLEPPGRDGSRAQGRLAAHRRYCDPGRRWLFPYCRPQEGRDHRWGLQSISERCRGSIVPAPKSGRGGCRGDTRRLQRRTGQGIHSFARRGPGERKRS